MLSRRAVDQGHGRSMPSRISDVVSKALDSGQLSVKRAEGAIAVSAGQMRLEQCQRRRQGRRLCRWPAISISPTARSMRGWCCRASGEAAGARPEIYHGVEGPGDRAGAQHRCVRVDRMADIAGDRQSSEAIARRCEERAARQSRSAPKPKKRTGAGTAGARQYQAGAPARSATRPEASVGSQN